MKRVWQSPYNCALACGMMGGCDPHLSGFLTPWRFLRIAGFYGLPNAPVTLCDLLSDAVPAHGQATIRDA